MSNVRIRPFVALGSVALIGMGILIGWLVFEGGEGPDSTSEPIESGWSVSDVPIPDTCGRDSSLTSRIAVRYIPEELRLSDYVPDESPIPRFVLAGYNGPIDAVNLYPATLRSGLVDGFARTFNDPQASGGFTVYALRYPSPTDAVQAAADAFGEEICRGGADPLEVDQRPGVFISYNEASGANSTARWVQGRDLIDVRYSSFGDPSEFLKGLLLVTRATWEV